MTQDDDLGERTTGARPDRWPARGGDRWSAPLAGLVSAAAGLAAAELAAALLVGARSPVTAIGAVVIDLAPPALKDAAIQTLGTADKPVLVAVVLVVLGAVAAGIGVLAAHRFWAGAVGVAGLGAIGLAAASASPASSWIGVALPSATAVIAGVSALWWLTSVKPTSRPSTARAKSAAHDAAAGPGRRAFVRSSALVGALAVAAGGVGRWLVTRPPAEAVTVPRASNRLPPVARDAAVPVAGMPPFVTSNDDFYRIDTALQVPRVDIDTWRLRVTGMVDNPIELTYDQLVDRYALVEADITLVCVSNEVGGDLVGTARWRGVRVADVLRDVGVRDGADQLVGRAVDGFTTGSPLSAVVDGRESLIAVGMNGAPLPAVHGFPARLVVPGLYGYVSATKWLTEIELTTFASFDAYWVPRGWAERAPIKTQSRIDVPRALETVVPGPVAVAGVAWAPSRGIDRVEVKVDDGAWEPARLGAEVSTDTWRQWVFEWDARPGRHELAVRATDGDGELQPAQRTPPRPDGATGRHRIVVMVAEA